MGDGKPGSPTTLFDLALSGRRTAMGQLIVLYDPLLERWVRRLLGPRRFRDEGEDLLQVIRLAVVRELPAVRQKGSRVLVAWLRKLVRSRFHDWERRRLAARRTPGASLVRLDGTKTYAVASAVRTPSKVFLAKEDAESLRRAIGDVPRRYRPVLEYILDHDPLPAEIVEFTGKDPSAARQFVARGLIHLRTALRKLERDDI